MQPIEELGEEIQAARAVLGSAARVVVLTGAGISTDSGIAGLGPRLVGYACWLPPRNT